MAVVEKTRAGAGYRKRSLTVWLSLLAALPLTVGAVGVSTASDALHSASSANRLAATEPSPDGQRQLSVITTLTVYASIALELVGEDSRVQSIAVARQDAHFVQAKPSYSIRLGRADLLVATGLDLELWLPAVVDKSRNPRVRSGEPGFVAAAAGIKMLEVPESPDRSAGDIHIFGNPHVHTDPLRAVTIAENISQGLSRVDPEGTGFYSRRLRDFSDRVQRRLFGDELVELVGGDKLADLEMAHRLMPFLENTSLGGRRLRDRLGGWLGDASCLRGKHLVPYHLSWIYFLDRFGLQAAAYVERRPGIPPSASHVAGLVELIRRDQIRVLWVANYFDRRIPELMAERTGTQLRYVPLYPQPVTGEDSYFGLVDAWIRELRSAFPDCGVS